MNVPNNVKRNKSHLLGALIFVSFLLLFGPYILASIGLMSELKDNVWIIQLIILVGILLNSFIGFLISGNFRYDKFSFELCLLVMGGTLSCLALQLTSNADLFPGINEISFLSFKSTLGSSIKDQNTFLLGMLFVLSLLGTLFSAIGVSTTDKGDENAIWSLFSTSGGIVLLASYTLAIISKGTF